MLSLDFETASQADLRRIGAYAYARHPTTIILCLAWAFDDEPVAVWRPGEVFPQRIIDHVAAGGMVRGWNVTFEWLIWNYVLHHYAVPPLAHTQLSDTMAAAAYWGLPLRLDAAAKAVRANILKDEDGHRLMLQMCRPRRIDPFTGKPAWWHLEDPAKYDRLCLYCQGDVASERAVGNAVPPLPAYEQDMWHMDLAMNSRGVPVDLDLVRQLRDLATAASREGNADLVTLTGGTVKTVTSTAALLDWLKSVGYPEDNLRKETVAERLDDPLCISPERDGLLLRSLYAKTSAAKLAAMLQIAGTNTGTARLNGMLQYYGAFRTGRWAGRLIQWQNLPRGTVKDVPRLLPLILRGDTLDDLTPFGNGLDIVVSALRSCITASMGRHLFVADFAQIEARVLAWLADQGDVLDVFRRGEDPYLYAAARQGSTNRAFGKVLVLALGYGMGAERFRVTAKAYGVLLSVEEAEAAVYQWREDNALTRGFWWACDAAVKAAIRHPGRPHQVGSIRFIFRNDNLLARLPSGRVLIYREARMGIDPVRPQFECITYMGQNQYTRKWERLRTWGSKIVENITQAVARDVMAEAALAAEAHGLDLCLMVHDELIGEAPQWSVEDALRQLLTIMRAPPVWAPDLPVDAAGWTGPRYRKG